MSRANDPKRKIDQSNTNLPPAHAKIGQLLLARKGLKKYNRRKNHGMTLRSWNLNKSLDERRLNSDNSLGDKNVNYSNAKTLRLASDGDNSVHIADRHKSFLSKPLSHIDQGFTVDGSKGAYTKIKNGWLLIAIKKTKDKQKWNECLANDVTAIKYGIQLEEPDTDFRGKNFLAICTNNEIASNNNENLSLSNATSTKPTSQKERANNSVKAHFIDIDESILANEVIQNIHRTRSGKTFAETKANFNAIKPARRLLHTNEGAAQCRRMSLSNSISVSQSSDISDGNDSVELFGGDADSTSIYKSTNVQHEGSLGEIVWAKLGSYAWWPAMIVPGHMMDMDEANSGSSWVFWFGDNKVSKIKNTKIRLFRRNYTDMLNAMKVHPKLWSKALAEAVIEYGRQGQISFESEEEYLEWAKGDFAGWIHSDNGIPADICSYLKSIGEGVYKKSTSELEKDKSVEKEKLVGALRLKVLGIKDVCIACLNKNEVIEFEHPLFAGGLCHSCKNTLMETVFAIGDDGSGIYCTVCGNFGNMLVCSSENCLRVFCSVCIDNLVGNGVREKLMNIEPWSCFLCDTGQMSGLLQVQPDWQMNVLRLFNKPTTIDQPELCPVRNAPIRVLSMFDGIGTGRYILDQLGIKVDVYYCCEIDPDAVLVSCVNFGDKITHLGDVRDLSVEKLENMCPIDLLIGGSPCNDISNVNPDRKGIHNFEGTGVLFFEFHRVLSILRSLSSGHSLLWLFENVAFMPHSIRSTISRFLQREPALWDAKYFSAQHRPRLFWGNIPGLYSLVLFVHSVPFSFMNPV